MTGNAVHAGSDRAAGGTTGAARGAVAFRSEALALLPEGLWIRCVRADSGFFAEARLAFWAERRLPYRVVARLTPRLQRRAARIGQGPEGDEHAAVGEFRARLFGWPVKRRLVVGRERVREDPAAVGRKLIDGPGDTFRIWGTNRRAPGREPGRDYNGRATVEQRIEALKNNLGADDFGPQNFWASAAAFRAVLFTFNRPSVYQHLSAPGTAYRPPATLRAAVFLCGAILGRAGRQTVLPLSACWGGWTNTNRCWKRSCRGKIKRRRSGFRPQTQPPPFPAESDEMINST